jgi:hypothetical protein
VLEQLEKEWGRIVDAVRAQSPRVAGCLRGARPLDFQRGTLVIGVPHRNRYQHAALGKSDSSTLLESVIGQVLGSRVKVRCQPHQFDEIPAEKETPPPKKEEPIDLEKLKEAEPMLGPLLDLFQGRVVAVRSRVEPEPEESLEQQEDV